MINRLLNLYWQDSIKLTRSDTLTSCWTCQHCPRIVWTHSVVCVNNIINSLAAVLKHECTLLLWLEPYLGTELLLYIMFIHVQVYLCKTKHTAKVYMFFFSVNINHMLIQCWKMINSNMYIWHGFFRAFLIKFEIHYEIMLLSEKIPVLVSVCHQMPNLLYFL